MVIGRDDRWERSEWASLSGEVSYSIVWRCGELDENMPSFLSIDKILERIKYHSTTLYVQYN